jgi:3-methyladenine DNA glycosylase AlkD
MENKVNDIIESLYLLGDEKRIEFAKKSYPTSMPVIGITNPNLKKMQIATFEEISDMSVDERFELAILLINKSIFEAQQLAFAIVANDEEILNILNEQKINLMAQNMDNWVSVDYFAVMILGHAWRNNLITIDKIKSYLLSTDVWQKRMAIVATVALNQKARGAQGDIAQTLEICSLVVDDHKELIIKAVSWALRELAKRDKQAVIDFIELYKNQISKRVLREVIHKLEFGNKN